MFVSFSATPQVTADFTTITSTTGCGSLTVEFNDLSLGSPTSWLWDFGNGNTSTLKDPIAIYNTPGVYDVVLTVSDVLTNDTKNSSSFIEVYEKPIAELLATSVLTGCMPLATSFEDVSQTNTLIDSWQWNFGDGGSSNIQNPNYTYITEESYSVSLSVTDINGCENLITEIDLVEVNKVPIADFNSDITFSCNSSVLVSFSNNSIDASEFLWDFGDGTTSNLFSPSHVFSTGVFSVTLYAKEGSCMDVIVMTDLIEVVASSSPNFTVNTNSGCEGLSVIFSDETTNSPNTFLWDFVDGSTSILQNPTHIFDTAGVYDITLTTSISSQCSTSIIFPAEIEIFSKPIISFTSDTILGCSIPFNVSFTDNTINAVNWSWDFGDGNSSNIQNPSNIYTSSNLFDVSLLVTNDFGCFSSVTFPNYIEVNEVPIVNFNSTTIVSCVGEDINFFDLSSLGTNSWHWSFGDESYSHNQNPIHQYSLAGDYDVSLISGVHSCKDTLIINDYIKIIEPTAIFTETYNCEYPLKVEFESLSIGADNVFWDFGDGTTSTLPNPVHVFMNLGVHTVRLTVNNNFTGCEHVVVKQIKLTKPIAQFDYMTDINYPEKDSVGCVPARMRIDNQSQDCAFFSVLWGDEYIGHGPSHFYTRAGLFDVTLIINDIHYCRDTVTIENMFHIHDITVDFDITNVLGCDSMLVNFFDLTIPESSDLQWDFGDGGTSIINNPEYIYYNEGYYDVTVFGETEEGCKDTLTRAEYIQFKSPIVDFSSNIQNVCVDEPVYFTNLSDGLGISSSWDFGDGISSNLLDPHHSFSVNGIYDINLLITDSFGCSDNLSLSNHIEVLSPTANFSALGLTSSCPPLISDFTNLSSSDVSLFEWSFGDGSISSIEDPSHLFISSGVFDISLIVENSFGCKDTLVQNGIIDILGDIPAGSFVISDTLICKDDIVSFFPTVVNTDHFLWDFGNGTVSTDSIATISYSDTGMFIPTLIIENSFGCQLSVNSDNTIKVNEVIIDAGIDIEICEGELVQLNAIGNSSLFTWSPANALSSISISNPQANPTTSGFYYVSHTDGLCTAVDSIFVNVDNNVPNATFTASNLCNGDITSFVASSGLATTNNSYIWSFGQNGQLVNSVLNIGNNNVSLIIENLNNSCKDTLVQAIEVFSNPVADFLVTDVCLGEVVNFTDNLSSSTTIWTYDFGDGIGVSSDHNPNYTYTNSGVFNVALSLTSNMGCEASIVKDVIIHELPIVDFSSNIQNVCVDEPVYFTNLSDGLGISSSWDFGDGFMSNDSIATHIFNRHGLFDVELTVTSNEGCSNFKVKTNEVFVNPIIDFITSESCKGEQTIFNASSFLPDTNIISYNWNFGLEGTSNNKNTMHTFSSDGVFDVSLLVVSDRGCESILSKEVTIYELPTPKFEVDSDICLGDKVEISYLSNFNDVNVVEWSYSLGDGNFSNEQNLIHTYAYTGTFYVSLEVLSSQGCKNDTTMPAIIEVHAFPIADFQASALFASELFPEINFYNNSEGATFFEWSFDNGDYSFEENPMYSFNNPQSYNVALTATNNFGCSSEMIKTVHIDKEYTFFVPDAFTPDGDGLNDVFVAQGNRISSFEMQVFDRWGGVIFESTSINLGWDGTDFSGTPIDNGIYLYHIALYDHSGRLWVYNGELKLMR
jgi:gliding motility-associated-like protein